MTYKELLEELQQLNEEQLNKQLTVYIPENTPSGFTTDVVPHLCCERWSKFIDEKTPYINIISL
jgi:hypothetical protein